MKHRSDHREHCLHLIFEGDTMTISRCCKCPYEEQQFILPFPEEPIALTRRNRTPIAIRPRNQ